MENKIYPQFISNLPCGDDYTEGKSQERLAVAIAEHITAADGKTKAQLPRIIGLKGEWGTGKSNVIKQLRKKLEKKYVIYEYDAWGHQEDLQRRSFLETLTERLLNDSDYSDYLNKSKKVVESESGGKITWKEKLDEILAHKRITKNISIPKINFGSLLIILFFFITPFIIKTFETFGYIDKIKNHFNCSANPIVDVILSILISISPFIVSAVVWLIIRCFDKDAKHLGYILKIYREGTTSDINIETINEEEPTVVKFTKWMKDLSDYISEYEKPKLIIVYDNMDRLPADKVKELWSSIHTFFAENGFENIWVIIPFDEKHLSCAFGEDKEKEQLTKHFISKTFPVVYRVTPPVITDYQTLFNKLYSQAFGETEEKDKETIYRILRLEKPDATIREMIEFINSLVALKQIWKEDIDLLYCAVFKLKEDEITSDAVNQILSGDYLGNYLKTIIPNDEMLQTNIAALVYGVPKELAEQIPMIKYIDSCFEDSTNDINKYSQSSKFADILNKNIQDADEAKTDSIIKSLSKLKTGSFNEDDKTKIANIWDKLVERKEKQKLSKQEFDESYQTLLSRVTDKENLIEKLCNRLQHFEKEGNEKFNGKDYYIAIRSIQDFISNNSIEMDITQYLTEIEKDPKIFVEYVQAAKEDYLKFKLSTDNKKLNEHFKENKLEDLSIINYIKDNEKYKFEELKQYIEELIPSDKLDTNNFKPILDAYKLISDEKPLRVQLTPKQRIQIGNHFANQVDKDEYLEIAAIQLVHNEYNRGNLTDEQIEYIAKQMDYYGNYGDLLVNSNNQNLNRVLKYMTENKLGCSLSLGKALPQFVNIKNKINVTEESLLMQLAKWSDQKDIITQGNIQNIIPKELYQFTKETDNDLTKHINEIAIKALSTVDENTLYNQLNQPKQPSTNNYWYKVVESLIDTDFCKSLPENVFNIGIRYLKEVASNGTIPQENSVRARIIKRLDKRKTPASIKDIRDTFCDSSQNKISTNVFLYFANWFEKQGDLISRADRVVHKIIEPVIEDIKCLQYIVNKPDYYSDIIIKAGNDASATIEKIEKIIKSGNVDEKIKKFGELIGIMNENKNIQ